MLVIASWRIPALALEAKHLVCSRTCSLSSKARNRGSVSKSHVFFLRVRTGTSMLLYPVLLYLAVFFHMHDQRPQRQPALMLTIFVRILASSRVKLSHFCAPRCIFTCQ